MPVEEENALPQSLGFDVPRGPHFDPFPDDSLPAPLADHLNTKDSYPEDTFADDGCPNFK